MSDLMSPESLTALIEEYASFGLHRTGWEGDEATSDWIAGWLEERGVEAGKAEFQFPRVEVAPSAAIEAAGERLTGTPLYDGGSTGPDGVLASLAVAEGETTARIVVLEQPALLPRFLEAPRDGGPAGVVVVSGDPEGEVVLRNAERIDAPFDLPALQVGRRHAAGLLNAAAAGREARLVINKRAVLSTATNVVANLKAPQPEGLVVIMTPKSGWFTCAAERGGGIAITMALGAHLATLTGRRKDVRILFTSGHEINHYGLCQYLDQHPELREEAETWVQLGASIGARYPAGCRVFSRADGLRSFMMEALDRHGATPAELADRDVRPGGESREVFDQRFVALAGGHRYFHSPQDTPAKAVDGERVARFGRAFQELLEHLVL